MLKSTKYMLLAAVLSVLSANIVFAETAETPNDGIWDKTKEVSSDVWNGTKEVGSDVWDGAKKVSGDVWNGAKEVGSDVKQGLSGDDNTVHQKNDSKNKQ